ncbi:hypothetical protein FOZ62_010684 [Perkinsus olseni]|uniref:SWIM-type domain-containing protein n=1 Tax=Perkinsus olseni TaxID=32597 RepID=A0A7J6RIK1_PEROL|nr:hypothetical protein FOZ62_010684 [Perkinsus olseni]
MTSQEPRRRSRGRAIEWLSAGTFEDECLARAWLEDSDNEYCKLRTNETKSGTKRYYYCKGCRRPQRQRRVAPGVSAEGSEQYPVQKMLHYDTFTTTVWAFNNGQGHCHQESDWGISRRYKILVDEQLSKGVFNKPQIIKSLEDLTGLTIELPKARQIESYIREFKKRQAGNSIRPTVHDLKKLVAEHSTIPSENDMDSAFVISSSFDDGIHITFSTRRLVALSRRSTMYAVDGTYKLMWQGFPLLVLAAVDEHNHTFPVALSIAEGERIVDYIKLFRSLDDVAPLLGLPTWSPPVILGDGAPCITGAIEAVFPNSERATCWYHAKQRMELILTSAKTPQEQLQAMLADICYLQLSLTPAMFQLGCKLYEEKYQSTNPTAVEDLKKRWFTGGNSCWFEGVSIRHPSTNNGLESANAKIKGAILREKLDVLVFGHTVAKKLMPMFSRDANPMYPQNYRKFESHTEIKVGKEDFAKASDWEQSDPPLCELNFPNSSLVLTVSTGVDKEYLNESNVNQFLGLVRGERMVETFDDLKDICRRLYAVSIPKSCRNWRETSCSCVSFLKDKVCYHQIAVGIRKDLLSPSDSDLLPINLSRRRPGRSSKHRPALVRNLSLDGVAKDRRRKH